MCLIATNWKSNARPIQVNSFWLRLLEKDQWIKLRKMLNLPVSRETIFAQKWLLNCWPALPLSGVVIPSPQPELPVIYGLLSAAQQPWSRASLVTGPRRHSCPLISWELTLVTWKTSRFVFFPFLSDIATGRCCLACCSRANRWSQHFVGSLRQYPRACTVGCVSQEGSSITQAYLRLQSLTLAVLGCREWQSFEKVGASASAWWKHPASQAWGWPNSTLHCDHCPGSIGCCCWWRAIPKPPPDCHSTTSPREGGAQCSLPSSAEA